MRAQHSISRRHVLRLAVTVGSLALSGGVRSVKAQAAKRIEQLAPELDKILATSEPIHELAEGFGGPQGPAEGPVWWQEGGYPRTGCSTCKSSPQAAFTERGWPPPRNSVESSMKTCVFTPSHETGILMAYIIP
jgi:hypothetical protein